MQIVIFKIEDEMHKVEEVRIHASLSLWFLEAEENRPKIA